MNKNLNKKKPNLQKRKNHGSVRESVFFLSCSHSPSRFSLKSFITIKGRMVTCQVWQIYEWIHAYTKYKNNVLMKRLADNEPSLWCFNVS